MDEQKEAIDPTNGGILGANLLLRMETLERNQQRYMQWVLQADTKIGLLQSKVDEINCGLALESVKQLVTKVGALQCSLEDDESDRKHLKSDVALIHATLESQAHDLGLVQRNLEGALQDLSSMKQLPIIVGTLQQTMAAMEENRDMPQWALDLQQEMHSLRAEHANARAASEQRMHNDDPISSRAGESGAVSEGTSESTLMPLPDLRERIEAELAKLSSSSQLLTDQMSEAYRVQASLQEGLSALKGHHQEAASRQAALEMNVAKLEAQASQSNPPSNAPNIQPVTSSPVAYMTNGPMSRMEHAQSSAGPSLGGAFTMSPILPSEDGKDLSQLGATVRQLSTKLDLQAQHVSELWRSLSRLDNVATSGLASVATALEPLHGLPLEVASFSMFRARIEAYNGVEILEKLSRELNETQRAGSPAHPNLGDWVSPSRHAPSSSQTSRSYGFDQVKQAGRQVQLTPGSSQRPHSINWGSPLGLAPTTSQPQHYGSDQGNSKTASRIGGTSLHSPTLLHMLEQKGSPYGQASPHTSEAYWAGATPERSSSKTAANQGDYSGSTENGFRSFFSQYEPTDNLEQEPPSAEDAFKDTATLLLDRGFLASRKLHSSKLADSLLKQSQVLASNILQRAQRFRRASAPDSGIKPAGRGGEESHSDSEIMLLLGLLNQMETRLVSIEDWRMCVSEDVRAIMADPRSMSPPPAEVQVPEPGLTPMAEKVGAMAADANTASPLTSGVRYTHPGLTPMAGGVRKTSVDPNSVSPMAVGVRYTDPGLAPTSSGPADNVSPAASMSERAGDGPLGNVGISQSEQEIKIRLHKSFKSSPEHQSASSNSGNGAGIQSSTPEDAHACTADLSLSGESAAWFPTLATIAVPYDCDPRQVVGAAGIQLAAESPVPSHGCDPLLPPQQGCGLPDAKGIAEPLAAECPVPSDGCDPLVALQQGYGELTASGTAGPLAAEGPVPSNGCDPLTAIQLWCEEVQVKMEHVVGAMQVHVEEFEEMKMKVDELQGLRRMIVDLDLLQARIEVMESSKASKDFKDMAEDFERVMGALQEHMDEFEGVKMKVEELHGLKNAFVDLDLQQAKLETMAVSRSSKDFQTMEQNLAQVVGVVQGHMEEFERVTMKVEELDRLKGAFVELDLLQARVEALESLKQPKDLQTMQQEISELEVLLGKVSALDSAGNSLPEGSLVAGMQVEPKGKVMQVNMLDVVEEGSSVVGIGGNATMGAVGAPVDLAKGDEVRQLASVKRRLFTSTELRPGWKAAAEKVKSTENPPDDEAASLVTAGASITSKPAAMKKAVSGVEEKEEVLGRKGTAVVDRWTLGDDVSKAVEESEGLASDRGAIRASRSHPGRQVMWGRISELVRSRSMSFVDESCHQEKCDEVEHTLPRNQLKTDDQKHEKPNTASLHSQSRKGEEASAKPGASSPRSQLEVSEAVALSMPDCTVASVLGKEFQLVQAGQKGALRVESATACICALCDQVTSLHFTVASLSDLPACTTQVLDACTGLGEDVNALSARLARLEATLPPAAIGSNGSISTSTASKQPSGVESTLTPLASNGNTLDLRTLTERLNTILECVLGPMNASGMTPKAFAEFSNRLSHLESSVTNGGCTADLSTLSDRLSQVEAFQLSLSAEGIEERVNQLEATLLPIAETVSAEDIGEFSDRLSTLEAAFPKITYASARDLSMLGERLSQLEATVETINSSANIEHVKQLGDRLGELETALLLSTPYAGTVDGNTLSDRVSKLEATVVSIDTTVSVERAKQLSERLSELENALLLSGPSASIVDGNMLSERLSRLEAARLSDLNPLTSPTSEKDLPVDMQGYARVKGPIEVFSHDLGLAATPGVSNPTTVGPNPSSPGSTGLDLLTRGIERGPNDCRGIGLEPRINAVNMNANDCRGRGRDPSVNQVASTPGIMDAQNIEDATVEVVAHPISATQFELESTPSSTPLVKYGVYSHGDSGVKGALRARVPASRDLGEEMFPESLLEVYARLSEHESAMESMRSMIQQLQTSTAAGSGTEAGKGAAQQLALGGENPGLYPSLEQVSPSLDGNVGNTMVSGNVQKTRPGGYRESESDGHGPFVDVGESRLSSIISPGSSIEVEDPKHVEAFKLWSNTVFVDDPHLVPIADHSDEEGVVPPAPHGFEKQPSSWTGIAGREHDEILRRHEAELKLLQNQVDSVRLSLAQMLLDLEQQRQQPSAAVECGSLRAELNAQHRCLEDLSGSFATLAVWKKAMETRLEVFDLTLETGFQGFPLPAERSTQPPQPEDNGSSPSIASFQPLAPALSESQQGSEMQLANIFEHLVRLHAAGTGSQAESYDAASLGLNPDLSSSGDPEDRTPLGRNLSTSVPEVSYESATAGWPVLTSAAVSSVGPEVYALGSAGLWDGHGESRRESHSEVPHRQTAEIDAHMSEAQVQMGELQSLALELQAHVEQLESQMVQPRSCPEPAEPLLFDCAATVTVDGFEVKSVQLKAEEDGKDEAGASSSDLQRRQRNDGTVGESIISECGELKPLDFVSESRFAEERENEGLGVHVVGSPAVEPNAVQALHDTVEPSSQRRNAEVPLLVTNLEVSIGSVLGDPSTRSVVPEDPSTRSLLLEDPSARSLLLESNFLTITGAKASTDVAVPDVTCSDLYSAESGTEIYDGRSTRDASLAAWELENSTSPTVGSSQENGFTPNTVQVDNETDKVCEKTTPSEDKSTWAHEVLQDATSAIKNTFRSSTSEQSEAIISPGDQADHSDQDKVVIVGSTNPVSTVSSPYEVREDFTSSSVGLNVDEQTPSRSQMSLMQGASPETQSPSILRSNDSPLSASAHFQTASAAHTEHIDSYARSDMGVNTPITSLISTMQETSPEASAVASPSIRSDMSSPNQRHDAPAADLELGNGVSPEVLNVETSVQSATSLLKGSLQSSTLAESGEVNGHIPHVLTTYTENRSSKADQDADLHTPVKLSGTIPQGAHQLAAVCTLKLEDGSTLSSSPSQDANTGHTEHQNGVGDSKVDVQISIQSSTSLPKEASKSPTLLVSRSIPSPGPSHALSTTRPAHVSRIPSAPTSPKQSEPPPQLDRAASSSAALPYKPASRLMRTTASSSSRQLPSVTRTQLTKKS